MGVMAEIRGALAGGATPANAPWESKKLGKEISWNLAETSEYFRGGRSGKTKT